LPMGYSGSSNRPAGVAFASRVGGAVNVLAPRHSRSSSRSSRRSGKTLAKR
jgi:hypothetical protein